MTSGKGARRRSPEGCRIRSRRELVKIDPKAIGVGQYQHDMNQKKLDGALTGVVEKCVNRVGVDLNTASFSLLSYISGISKNVAKNIVSYREENGAFRNRKELLKVTGLGPKAFQQCAGFLRGDQPLDETSVHPESYSAVKELLAGLGLSMDRESFKAAVRMTGDPAAKAKELGIGEPTLRDILSELEKPARDPREEMPAPVLRSDVLSIEDLKPGLTLKGTVRNIVDFGAFVDIGVHQDGLVHISKMSRRFIKHPLEVVRVGDVTGKSMPDMPAKHRRKAPFFWKTETVRCLWRREAGSPCSGAASSTITRAGPAREAWSIPSM